MLAAMFDPLTDFWLASDGTRLTVMGAACWIMAAVAGLMEWRRGRGRAGDRLERVGWVPWTPIFMACAMIGGGFLAMGLPAALAEI